MLPLTTTTTLLLVRVLGGGGEGEVGRYYLPRFTNSKTFLETPGGARVILKRRIVLVVPGFWRLSGGAVGGVVVRDILGSCRDLYVVVVEFWLVFGWRKVLIWAWVTATASGGGRCFG